MAELGAEIRANTQRYVLNIARLKSFLHYMGDETFHAYPDWDWRWPTQVSLATFLHNRFDDGRWQPCIPSALAEQVITLYTLLADQPPSMDAWASEWDGNINTFYLFIMTKLDGLCDEVNRLASGVETALKKA